MRTILYYFTGTGNNLAVAKGLAAELGGTVDIIPIVNAVRKEFIIADTDVVGIIFPVYTRDIPGIVEEFAKKLIVKDSYVFGVCTYHKDPFNALFNLNAVLEQKGTKLDAGFTINMPGNSVLIIDLTSTDEENEQRFREAAQKIKAIAEAVHGRKQVGIEGRYNPDETYETKNYIKYVYKVLERFWVNENCDSCGLCAQVCPKNAISIVEDKPVWTGSCENCLACLHWCPNAAVQNGDNSAKCRRYHHPDISVTDIIAQKGSF